MSFKAQKRFCLQLKKSRTPAHQAFRSNRSSYDAFRDSYTWVVLAAREKNRKDASIYPTGGTAGEPAV